MVLHQTFLLHEGQVYPHYYLCNYLPRLFGYDPLSASLLNFKTGRQPDLDGWIEGALGVCVQMDLPPGALIVRALHHHETAADPRGGSPLDLLGLALADRLGATWFPGLLCKTSPVRRIKRLPTPDRERILRDIYYICSPPAVVGSPWPPTHAPAILLIDDILSTGSTARAILRTLLGQLPHADLTLFTLAKASPCGNK